MDQFFISYLWRDPRLFFSLALVVVLSVCCHEFMHAYTALRSGDPTAADAGHLTLNPAKQMGLLSILMFALLGIAWGAVPVNPSRMRSRYAPALVAAAGPLTNLVLALLFIAGGYLVARGYAWHHSDFAIRILLTAGVLNFVLLILNLMPVPGLDGWTILLALIPSLRQPKSEFLRGFFFVLVIVLFSFYSKLYALAEYLTLQVVTFCNWIGSLL